MHVIDDDGFVLDAHFHLEADPLSIIYESAGGKLGINARNRDYGIGLPMILSRLRQCRAILTEIRVDSVVTRRAAPAEQVVALKRYTLPLPMATVDDILDLKRDISTAARLPAARAGASTGGSSRRLRLQINTNDTFESVEQTLQGNGADADEESISLLLALATGRGRVPRGQGFLLSTKVRQVIEQHAMNVATRYYSKEWTVTDVHATHSYDLVCSDGARRLFVEVNGTRSLGLEVLVTAHEVALARAQYPNTEMFVLSQIKIDDPRAPAPLAHGGVVNIHPGWGLNDEKLRAMILMYSPGASRDENN